MTRMIKCPRCGMRAYLGANSVACKCGYSIVSKKMAALCPVCKTKAARSAFNGIVTTTCFRCGYTASKRVIPKGPTRKKG